MNEQERAELARQTAGLNEWVRSVPAMMAARRAERGQMSRTAERTAGLRPQRPPTAHERTMIDAMRRTMYQGDAETATWLAANTGQTPQGAARVLGSCARKGLVRRHRGRPVRFSLTQRGWDLARPRAQQWRAR